VEVGLQVLGARQQFFAALGLTRILERKREELKHALASSSAHLQILHGLVLTYRFFWLILDS